MKIYHQLGHNHKWNIQSLTHDYTGHGVIFAPRFMNQNHIDATTNYIIERSFFDPQFYLPSSPLGELKDYDFFPDNIADGFSSSDYGDTSRESAKRCVKFQNEKGFKYITIPTRYSAGMPTNFIESQKDLFVKPFLNAVQQQNIDKPVLLQLILNDTMIKDVEYSADLLNWITGIDEIAGVYLIIQISPRRKQIDDIDFLLGYLKFIDALVQNKLDVVLGYLNTEAILLSVANPTIVTVGVYENTRMFNVHNYEIKDKKKQLGPNARIYISKLLQWVDSRYKGAILNAVNNDLSFFDNNKYQALMFEPTYNWNFQKPELYKHHFLVFTNQLMEIGNLQGVEKYYFVKSKLESAIQNYEILDNNGVVFDRDSGGNHLPAWLTALKQFAKYKGWE